MLDFFSSIDNHLFIFLNTFISNFLFDYFFKFITDKNNIYLALFIAGVIFTVNKKLEALRVIGVALIAIGLSDLIGGQFLKPFFHRMRPCHPSYFVEGRHLFLEGANFLCGMKRGGSFPSNHAMNAFTLATVLTLFYPKNFFYYYTFAILVAYSRIYVGVHYPSDVLFGASLGIVIGMSIYYLFYYIKMVLKNKRELEIILKEVRPGNEEKEKKEIL